MRSGLAIALPVTSLFLLSGCLGSGESDISRLLSDFDALAEIDSRLDALEEAEGLTERASLTTGTASYTGGVLAIVDDTSAEVERRLAEVEGIEDVDPRVFDAIGRARLTADFSGEGSISGTFDRFRLTEDGSGVSGSLDLAAAPITADDEGQAVFTSSLSGTLSARGEALDFDGTAEGGFVGTNARFVDGTFTGQVTDGIDIGFFAGGFIAEDPSR